MKKLLSILALAIAVFLSFSTFIGCSNPEPTHEHSFVNGFCECGDIKFGELLTKETLSNVTITTDEDLTILRRQPIGSFPWFGNESGTSREFRTVKIAGGIVEENYHITFTERHEEGELVFPVVKEGVNVGTEMSKTNPNAVEGVHPDMVDRELANFERHFDIILNILGKGTFTFDQERQVYVSTEYGFKMTNLCCDSIDAHEVIFKIENKRVTYLYFDIYVSAHDTVSTWNCEMKSTFTFSDYGTTVIE